MFSLSLKYVGRRGIVSGGVVSVAKNLDEGEGEGELMKTLGAMRRDGAFKHLNLVVDADIARSRGLAVGGYGIEAVEI